MGSPKWAPLAARAFYEIETTRQAWSTRQLERQIADLGQIMMYFSQVASLIEIESSPRRARAVDAVIELLVNAIQRMPPA